MAEQALIDRIELAVQCWQTKINNDVAARESLRFLAGKAKRSEESLLRDLLQFFWPYSIPPARSRLQEVEKMEKFATRLRRTAKELREDPTLLPWAGILPGRYLPRRSKELLTIPESPILLLHPELEHLPEMLEQYVAALDDKAHLLRQYAKQEPTKKQHYQDIPDEMANWIQQVIGKAYRERVWDILRMAGPSFYIEAETLRKRTYRHKNSRSA